MLILFIAGSTAIGEPIAIRTIPIVLDLSEPHRNTVGQLTYMGGLALNSPHPDFGGWSGIWVSPDGSRLVALGDRGHWLTAQITFSDDGFLIGLSEAELIPMLDTDGIPVQPPWADAESIAALNNGFLVAFERAHRYWWYPGTTATELEKAVPRKFFHPQLMHDAPSNGGVEALTTLNDGNLLAFAEELVGPNGNLGWISDDREIKHLISLATMDGYVPTGATTLTNGQVLVLQRRFDFLGFQSQILRLDQTEIVADGKISGTQIARLTRPLVSDNFEAITAVADAQGTLVYLLSDNNFSVFQRTLLLLFRLGQ